MTGAGLSVPVGTWRGEVVAGRHGVWLALWSDGWPGGSRQMVPDTPCDAATAQQLRALADAVDRAMQDSAGVPE
jgi:hypothetical protein